MFINKMGIAGDEHDMTFHGGVDKAVHGCESRLISSSSSSSAKGITQRQKGLELPLSCPRTTKDLSPMFSKQNLDDKGRQDTSSFCICRRWISSTT